MDVAWKRYLNLNSSFMLNQRDLKWIKLQDRVEAQLLEALKVSRYLKGNSIFFNRNLYYKINQAAVYGWHYFRTEYLN